ncbi:MAG: hypothetical protein WBN75_13050 [Verrucomicrobiia bacterium]|jgi:hypothetical protein
MKMQNMPDSAPSTSAVEITNTGHPYMVSGWLHPDPNKRTEPKLNIGLAILEIYKTELKTNKKTARHKRLKSASPRPTNIRC